MGGPGNESIRAATSHGVSADCFPFRPAPRRELPANFEGAADLGHRCKGRPLAGRASEPQPAGMVIAVFQRSGFREDQPQPAGGVVTASGPREYVQRQAERGGRAGGVRTHRASHSMRGARRPRLAAWVSSLGEHICKVVHQSCSRQLALCCGRLGRRRSAPSARHVPPDPCGMCEQGPDWSLGFGQTSVPSAQRDEAEFSLAALGSHRPRFSPSTWHPVACFPFVVVSRTN